MASDKVLTFSDNNFDSDVLKAETPVLVDFWAPWCAPCRMVAPLLDKIALEYAGKVVVAKINTDESTRWAAHYGISGIPTMLFISGGQVVNQQVGALSYSQLKLAVDRFLATTQSAAEAAS